MKSDAFFGLDHASWPAFLVEAGGTVRHANQAAIQFFAQKLEGESTLLSAIWSPDNDLGADAFLSQWERSPQATLTKEPAEDQEILYQAPTTF